MEGKDLMVFTNDKFGNVRVVMNDGKPYFVGKDVAICLGYADPSSAISKKCKHGVKTMLEAPCQYGNVVKTQTTIIPEGDIYRLVFGSELPNAIEFQDWVCDEVLPSIREKGYYSIAPVQDKRASLLMSIIDAPDDVTRALAVKNYTDCVTAPLKEQLAEQAPKVEYCDAVLNSYSGVTTTVIAQDYGMSAQKFNKLLNKLHIQYKQGNTWVLYREHKGKGYTESETIVKNGYSVVSTRWTQKGRQFIYETLKDAGILPVKEINEVKENNEAD